MDPIQNAVNVLRKQIAARQEAIDKLVAFRDDATTQNSTASGVWTPARRKAAGLRAKAAWRKRKAAAVQNRVKVSKLAAKKG